MTLSSSQGAHLVIRGGMPLTGRIRPMGNKNAALPMLAACLLTDKLVCLRNVPDIQDVRVMLELLSGLGVEVTHRGHTVHLCAARLNTTRLDPGLCRKVRSSILCAGPLAARHESALLAPPGGDGIGRRRIDTHLAGLESLGMKLSIKPNGSLSFSCKSLHGADLLLDEASVTATENVLMAACLSKGKTVIYNAACEPHVSDLGHLLIRMGAHIEGLGTNRIIVRGVKRLKGATHTVGADFIEVGSFAVAALATRGHIEIGPLGRSDFMPVIARGFRQLGVTLTPNKNTLLVDGHNELIIRDDIGSAVPKIEDGPWPAFPSDLMSVALVLATQARGTILFFEKLFESRMYFVDRLLDMGARIVQCDPHRVLVTGPAQLRGSHQTSPDIRAGMALVIAALAAEGTSTIEHAGMIDRGYERIDERLRALGADIERI